MKLKLVVGGSAECRLKISPHVSWCGSYVITSYSKSSPLPPHFILT